MTDDAVLAETAAALKDTGVGVADVEIVRLKAETDVADFTPFFARAERLGAKNVLVAGDDPEEARLTALLAEHGQQPLRLPFDALGRDALVTDLVYTPLMTDFLIEAQSRAREEVDVPPLENEGDIFEESPQAS